MSRTYMKFINEPLDLYPTIWHSFRTQERGCISKEIQAGVNGDVVFPKYYHHKEKYGGKSVKRMGNRIAKRYGEEISFILNGGGINRYDFRFWEEVQLIKEEKHPRFFEWLKHRNIKKIVKNWEGGVFDVLYYLDRHGFIRKAARLRQKRWFRK